MGCIGRNLVVIAMAVPFLAACAGESLGPEYREISEEESGLQFYAPGLAGGYRNILSGQDDKFVKRMIAVYGPKQGEFPHGQLILTEMPPGRHFTRIDPPADKIEEWGQFENRQIVRGTTGTAINAIGRIAYAAFQADGMACIIFRQPFGTVYGTGRGTNLLDGYYCKGGAGMINKGEAVSIVKAIGHRKYGVVSRPSGWPSATAVAVQPKPKPAKPNPPSGSGGGDSAGGGMASGTGFFVNARGVIVTNAHVIDRCEGITVRSFGRANIVAADKSLDLAAIRLERAGTRPFAQFKKGKPSRLGQDIVVFGFPLSNDLSSSGNLTTGNISALAGIGNNSTRYQISAPIQPGNSGGPMFDRSGAVVGVVVSSLNEMRTLSRTGAIPQNVNFAVKGAFVKSFLNAHRIEYSESAGGKSMDTSEVAEQAQDVSVHIICRLAAR